MRLLVRSLGCCVLATGAWAQWYGGNWDNAYTPSSASNITVIYPPPVQSPSVVVIERRRPAPMREPEYAEPQQTAYLIALKNSVVRVADQYWVKGNTLFFLTPGHQLGTVPLESVDRTLSRQLNSEQNVAFVLPAVQVATTSRLVHQTATVVRKRCYCRVTTKREVIYRRPRAVQPPSGAAEKSPVRRSSAEPGPFRMLFRED